MRMRAFSLPLLVAWTLLVWIGRIRNIIQNDSLSGWSMLWRLGVAVGFSGVALFLGFQVVTSWRTRNGTVGSDAVSSLVTNLASGLAVFGIGWWVVRGGGILMGDHEVAFKVVHSVLGSVTIVLSSMVLWVTKPFRALSVG